jgi:hypothetical protein
VQALVETNYLVPDGTFLLSLAVLGFAALLVVWPLVESLALRQRGYALGILLLGPIGGLVWLTVGRHQTRRSMELRATSA